MQLNASYVKYNLLQRPFLLAQLEMDEPITRTKNNTNPARIIRIIYYSRYTNTLLQDNFICTKHEKAINFSNTAYHILATRWHGRALITGSIMHAEGWDGCHHFEGSLCLRMGARPYGIAVPIRCHVTNSYQDFDLSLDLSYLVDW